MMAMTPGKAPQVFETDLLVIGSGMAGMAAAVFAGNRHIKTIVAGAAGRFEYASGLMDLWGLSLTNKRMISKKPWDMLARLRDQPLLHPYAKLENKEISAAFFELTKTLKNNGLTYTGYPRLNHGVLTPFGTVHPTFRLPLGLKANADAFKRKPASLILDFRGLREFSAQFFCEMVKKKWPNLSPACIEFPGSNLRAEVFTPFLARAMETRQIQDRFINQVKPLLKGKSCLGVPAILGVQSGEKIRQRMEEELGVTVFEIPTSPVSVPGSRLKEALVKSLEKTTVTGMFNHRVIQVEKISGNGFGCILKTGQTNIKVRAKVIVIATGRFLSKGLVTEEYRIKEPLFDLHVNQPESRSHWHAKEYFSRNGHLINRAGIETDELFRPVHTHKGVVHENLYAVGSILAHQDWVRTKSGSGLAIATAYRAIKSCFQKF